MTILGIIGLSMLAALTGGAPMGGASDSQECASIAGLETITSDKRFIVLGELHGTREIPEFASTLACHLSQDRPLVLSLEIPEERQADLDAYMASMGDEAAKVQLLRGLFWQVRLADGRSSEAILNLLDDVRRYAQAGHHISVRASAINGGQLDQDLSEILIAADWIRSASVSLDVRVLVLVGRAHAGRDVVRGFRPAASHLPDDETLRLQISEPGGSYWACLRSVCGEQKLEVEAPLRPAGIYPRRGNGFDGWFSVGKALTASPPAIEGGI